MGDIMFGNNLKALRKGKNMTQGDLSEKSGIKLGHISKLERDETDPKISTVYKLIDALECDANSLLQNKSSGGVSAMLERALKMTDSLPIKQKATLLDVVEHFYLAASVKNAIRWTGDVPEEVIYGIKYELEMDNPEHDIEDLCIQEAHISDHGR